MTGAGLALVVATLLSCARLPWRAGIRQRLSVLAASHASGGGEATRSPGGASGATVVRVAAMRSAASDVVQLLELVDVAVSTGAGVPRAIEAVGDAVGGDVGLALRRVASGLLLGASWSEAWDDSPASFEPLAGCLEAAWTQGSAPGPGLRARADAIRRERRRVAREAAGRLGVHLVLPLGLCFLPSFVLLGLVPVLVSLAGGLVG